MAQLAKLFQLMAAAAAEAVADFLAGPADLLDAITHQPPDQLLAKPLAFRPAEVLQDRVHLDQG